MIVNPQLFNYRLIKGSLVIAVAVVTVLGYLKYQSIESQNASLKQENKLIVNELSQVLKHNDVISNENEMLSLQLETIQEVKKAAADSIAQLTQNLSVMSKYKTRNLDLKKQLSSSASQLYKVDSALQSAEQSLHQANAQLEQQTEQILSLQNGDFTDGNYYKSKPLSANYISVKGYETSLSSRIFTTKAKKINNLEVCLNLAEDTDVNPGSKTIYIQIINPDNNVVADKGMVAFNSKNLIYSYKTTVEYMNKHTTVCTAIEADQDDKPLKKGTYRINVFNDAHLVGSTTLYLD